MIPRRLSEITVDDIYLLKGNGVPESRTIEYKSQLPHSGESQRITFLAEVCAFANTAGGDLIFGVEEDKGVPSDVPGVQVEDIDKEILRLESSIKTGIEPPIAELRFNTLDLSPGNFVIVLRVGRSWNAPHRVNHNSKSYVRGAARKYPLDVSELRAAFTYSELIPERIRRFREDRVTSICADRDLPVPLNKSGRIALHVIPLSALTSQNWQIITPKSRYTEFFRPLGAEGWSHKLNIDGIVTYNKIAHDIRTYAQIFRSGIIETVFSLEVFDNGKLNLPSIWFEQEIIKSCQMYISSLSKFDIIPPFYVFLSFIDMAKVRLIAQGAAFDSGELNKDLVLFPEIVIEDVNIDFSSSLRPLFDMVWNAFGYERSLNYDENGKRLK